MAVEAQDWGVAARAEEVEVAMEAQDWAVEAQARAGEARVAAGELGSGEAGLAVVG